MPSVIPFFSEPSLARSQPTAILRLEFSLTAGSGVNTAALISQYKPRLLVEGGTGSALTTITQSAVDDLLGSTNEVIVATAFGTTAMVDNNTYAWVLACDGQVAEVIGTRVIVDIAGTVGVSAGRGTTTAFTDAAFTRNAVYVTSEGNLAGRITYTNISAAATAGFMFWDLSVRLK